MDQAQWTRQHPVRLVVQWHAQLQATTASAAAAVMEQASKPVVQRRPVGRTMPAAAAVLPVPLVLLPLAVLLLMQQQVCSRPAAAVPVLAA